MVVILPVIVIIQTCFIMVGPLLLKKYPAWVPLLLGTTIICSGVLLSSFAKGLTAYMLLFAVGMGVGNGICYITPVVVGWEYFPNNKGAVSGVIMCGFGLASFIFSFIVQAIVNPENASATVKSTGGYLYEP